MHSMADQKMHTHTHTPKHTHPYQSTPNWVVTVEVIVTNETRILAGAENLRV